VSSKSLAIDKELESKEEIFIFKEEEREPRPRRRCRPIVHFTNNLQADFTLVDPNSVKNTVKSSVSFYASGSASAKAEH